MAHAVRGWTAYTPSNTVQFGSVVQIKCDTTTVVNNPGAELNSTPLTNQFWPAHRADLRAVYGVDLTLPQYKDSCIAMLPTGALFVLGANFVDNETNLYTVNALRAEKFRIRNLK